jgi:hypothetical protein
MWSPEKERRQPALELNPATIEIQQVHSIEVGAEVYRIHRQSPGSHR